MTTIKDASDLRRTIATALADNPSWLPETLAGVTHGMERAIQKVNERAALKDMATLSALALLRGGRFAPELRETLLARVTAAIHPANQCGYERGMIDAHLAQAIEAGTGETLSGSIRQDESAVRKDAP